MQTLKKRTLEKAWIGLVQNAKTTAEMHNYLSRQLNEKVIDNLNFLVTDVEKTRKNVSYTILS